MFDLRFVEGELLFFTRDEGLLRRRRRTVHFAIDLGDLFHSRLSGYGYQFGVLAQSLCLRILDDLLAVFADDSVHAVVHYLHGQDRPEPLEEESRLLRLLLSDAIEHQWAEVRVAPTLSLSELRDVQRKQYLLVFAGDNAAHWQRQLESARAEESVHGLVVQVGPGPEHGAGNLWRLPPEGLAIDELTRIKDQLVQHTVGG